MDQLGFGLEQFNPIGAWRTTVSDKPVDSAGELPGGGKFNGAPELKTLLVARKDEFTRNVAGKMLSYALGRGVDNGDWLAVRQIAKAKFFYNSTTGDDGGGLYLRTSSAATIMVTGSLFKGNSSGDEGGAIALHSGTTAAILSGLTITDNFTKTDGGGISIFGGPVTISKTMIARNFATTNGGAMSAFTGAVVALQTSIVTGNVAKVKFGGLYSDGATITIAPTSKVFGNIAPTSPNNSF